MRAAIFAEWFGTTRTAGRVLEALFDADTAPLTAPEIAQRTGLAPNTVYSAIVRLRAAVDGGEVVTDGRRYVLTEAGCADCLEALSDAARRELAA